ncbi:MAG TPA: class I SAM-dependent methyltransferase [Streptosporangiaceae bacterium]|nr:class I SAM-dependent methyltransferase [Streptosporangiaceae bacterium]
MNTPSRTSQAVALIRVGLDRPHSSEGDPGAQRRLCKDMQFSAPGWLLPSIEARTRFVDDQVIRAIANGTRQIVICGAGYDDRALRFRTSGVRFFELDHPATQADKARLLVSIGAEPPAGSPAVTLAKADFRSDDVAVVLHRAGHEASLPTLFVCEGLLVYLDRPTCHALLGALAQRAATGSVLVVSMATHADGLDSGEVARAANARRRAGEAEPWRTILPVAEHLALIEQAGWAVTTTQWSPVPAADVTHGRRSLLATAEPLRQSDPTPLA